MVNIENLKKENTILKSRLNHAQAELTIVKFLRWIVDDMRLDELNNRLLYGGEKE